jgi:hypothetical protein
MGPGIMLAGTDNTTTCVGNQQGCERDQHCSLFTIHCSITVFRNSLLLSNY